ELERRRIQRCGPAGGNPMSARLTTPRVLEWSSRGILGYDSTTKTTRTFSSFTEAAGIASDAIVAVGGRSVFLRVLRVPDVSPEEVRQILRLRLTDLFPVATNNHALDFQLTEDVNAKGRLALVAALPTAELAKLYSELRAAG